MFIKTYWTESAQVWLGMSEEFSLLKAEYKADNLKLLLINQAFHPDPAATGLV